mgnify:CR=1 FL=1
MERAAGRNRGNIDEVIYVLCENDFEQGGKGSSPEELTAFLADFAAREKLARVTLVSVPYIYNTVPEITRPRPRVRFGTRMSLANLLALRRVSQSADPSSYSTTFTPLSRSIAAFS